MRQIVETEERKRRSREAAAKERRTASGEEVVLEAVNEPALELEGASPPPAPLSKKRGGTEALAATLPYVAQHEPGRFTQELSHKMPVHNRVTMDYLAAALPAELRHADPELAPETVKLLIKQLRLALVGTAEHPKFNAIRPDMVGDAVADTILEVAPDFPKERIAALRQRAEAIAEKIPLPVAAPLDVLLGRKQILPELLKRAEKTIADSQIPLAQLEKMSAPGVDRNDLSPQQKEAAFALMEKRELAKQIAAFPQEITETLHELQTKIVELKRDRQLLANTLDKNKEPRTQKALITLLDYNIAHAEYILKEAVRHGHHLPGSEAISV